MGWSELCGLEMLLLWLWLLNRCPRNGSRHLLRVNDLPYRDRLHLLCQLLLFRWDNVILLLGCLLLSA